MKKIIFVCHGNICRSPAAEYIFKLKIKQLNREDEFLVSSCATSYEEIGNDIYPPMKRALSSMKIPFSIHASKRFNNEDYESADYIFYMDSYNLRNLKNIKEDVDNKYLPISHWSEGIYDIEDPWYTDNYIKVINQISKCVEDILKHI